MTHDPNCPDCNGTGRRLGGWIVPGMTHPCRCRVDQRSARYDVEQTSIRLSHVTIDLTEGPRRGLGPLVSAPDMTALAGAASFEALAQALRVEGLDAATISEPRPGHVRVEADGAIAALRARAVVKSITPVGVSVEVVDRTASKETEIEARDVRPGDRIGGRSVWSVTTTPGAVEIGFADPGIRRPRFAPTYRIKVTR